MKKPMSKLSLVLLLTLALIAASCGDNTTSTADTSTDTEAPATTAAPADDMTDDMSDDMSTDTEAPATTAAPADDMADDMTDDMSDDMADDMAMSTPGDGVSVTMARANWSTGYMQAAIYKQLLEELGYEVNEPADQELGPSNFYTALGEGQFDFWANSWMPGHYSWFENELTDGSTVGDKVRVVGEEMLAGGLQGYLTNASIAAEYPGLTIDQINSTPELIELYDQGDTTPGDGKVQILGCPEDWTCDDIISENITFAGWDNIEQTKAGYDAMVAEAVGRAADDIPFIIYTWTPSAYVTELIPGVNASWLAIEESSLLDGSITAAFDQRVDGVAVPASLGTDVCTADPCHLGWVAADILVTANNEFLAANPAAEELFRLVTISVVDVALQNVLYKGGEDTTEDVNRHAADWIESNRAQVDEWLAAARAAA